MHELWLYLRGKNIYYIWSDNRMMIKLNGGGEWGEFDKIVGILPLKFTNCY